MIDVLNAFDRYLEERALSFRGTVIGGAALIVMGVVDRATKDVDCLEPRIPEDVVEASREFARSPAGAAMSLREDWLNNGPESLARDLPGGWMDRRVALYSGNRLILTTLGRMDLLRAKLFAYCDRQQDFGDCVALAPTALELATCLPWIVDRDTNPLWPDHVRKSLEALKEELKRGSDA